VLKTSPAAVEETYPGKFGLGCTQHLRHQQPGELEGHKPGVPSVAAACQVASCLLHPSSFIVAAFKGSWSAAVAFA